MEDHQGQGPDPGREGPERASGDYPTHARAHAGEHHHHAADRHGDAGADADDGVDRRGFLGCMAWAGTAVLWTARGGGLTSRLITSPAVAAAARKADFSFVQISDSHIGFDAPPNEHVTTTFEEAIARINALPQRPAFVVHTGDHVHTSKGEEFDTVKELMRTIKTDQLFNVPGEHDVYTDLGKQYMAWFGSGSRGTGYYSFNYHGVHVLALANVQPSENAPNALVNPIGLGELGAEQIEWVKKDLQHLHSDTPIIVFGHVPLIAVYPQWGWATTDGEQVLSMLKRFSSVTVLNGHIHQILSKSEGNIVMYTARGTAFPQRPPGDIAPGPYPVPPEELPQTLGVRFGTVKFVRHGTHLAIKDESLAE